MGSSVVQLRWLCSADGCTGCVEELICEGERGECARERSLVYWDRQCFSPTLGDVRLGSLKDKRV